jgi:hypothetical protein
LIGIVGVLNSCSVFILNFNPVQSSTNKEF